MSSPTRRQLLTALAGSAAVAGCTDEEPDTDPSSTSVDDSRTEPTATDESDSDDEPQDSADDDSDAEEADESEEPAGPDLAEREEELPELIRESLNASRNNTAAALSIYTEAVPREDRQDVPAVLSVSLLEEGDRIGMQRQLNDAADRLDGAVTRADLQGIDDDPARRIFELLGAEIETLSTAAVAHETLARGFGRVESVVELADQRAYRLAADEHDDLTETSAEASVHVADAADAVEVIAAAVDREREILVGEEYTALVDRLRTAEEVLLRYRSAVGDVPSIFEDLDDADTARAVGDNDEALALAQIVIEDLDALISEIESIERPETTEPLETFLLVTFEEKLQLAREIRDDARAAME
ncbi:MAG: hypothetical protein PPP58_09610 [Natronomonas sp.]